MKRSPLFVLCLLLGSLPALAASLGTAASAVVPADVQQIISVDYRMVNDSPTALALKARILPENLKLFETALRGVGIVPEKDMDNLVFASFRSKEKGLRVMGVAQGQFGRTKVLRRMRVQKIRPTRYRSNSIYPMGNGMELSFLDDSTMVFGDSTAVKQALDTRDGVSEGLASNRSFTDMIAAVGGGAVWSVLDAAGTQNMMRSALGAASTLGDYETVKKRLLGSRYTMDFANGVNFDLDVLTSDPMTAATLTSLVKAGVLFRKGAAKGAEKDALENVTVESDSSNLRVRFKSDDQKFQALLKSDLFAAVSR